MKPLAGGSPLQNGFFYFLAALTAVAWGPAQAYARDGATEALEVRLQAELAIRAERQTGQAELADVMQEILPELLLGYMVTRDGSVALDTVDAVFVREELEMAKAEAQPGVALALDVFSGPGTGYENGVRDAINKLASFQGEATLAERVSESAVQLYERRIERNIETAERKLQEIEKHLERPQTEILRLEAKLELKDEKFELKRLAEAKGLTDKEVVQLEKKLERAEEKAERAAEKAEEKAEEKVEKAAEKAEEAAEKAEKAAEKAEEKAEEKVEKAAEKAEEAAEKAEKKAEKLLEEAGGNDSDENDSDKKNKIR